MTRGECLFPGVSFEAVAGFPEPDYFCAKTPCWFPGQDVPPDCPNEGSKLPFVPTECQRAYPHVHIAIDFRQI